jgi:dTDP-4-amino-4,6-dideoxygalactose transaminase
VSADTGRDEAASTDLRASAETLGAPAGSIPFFAAEREFAAHGRELLERVNAVLRGGQTLQGEQVRAFEDTLAERAGRAHAVAVGSGTDALFFALRALGVGPGDEVLVPALSFIASASCVVRAGALPVFVDTDERHLLDLDSARARLTAKTRAVIAVDLFGQTPDRPTLDAFAREHGVAIVEDAAQALGAEHACAIGTVSCLSFDPTKPLAAPGSGGALLTDDLRLAAHARRLRWHGRDADGRYGELGYNSQLPEISAAVLRHKLELEPTWRAARQRIAARYDAALAAIPTLEAPARDHARGHAFSKYVIRSPDRERLRELLQRAGVPTRIHYPRALSSEPLFAGAQSAACPNAERASREVLSLPIHAFLHEHEVDRVADALAVTSAAGLGTGTGTGTCR